MDYRHDDILHRHFEELPQPAEQRSERAGRARLHLRRQQVYIGHRPAEEVDGDRGKIDGNSGFPLYASVFKQPEGGRDPNAAANGRYAIQSTWRHRYSRRSRKGGRCGDFWPVESIECTCRACTFARATPSASSTRQLGSEALSSL